jgi:hypothetical protein
LSKNASTREFLAEKGVNPESFPTPALLARLCPQRLLSSARGLTLSLPISNLGLPDDSDVANRNMCRDQKGEWPDREFLCGFVSRAGSAAYAF